MSIHQDVLNVVNERILPHVLRIHEVDVPYPAELWVNGKCEHEDGTAMFSIDDEGFLTAEYFAYDEDYRMPWGHKDYRKGKGKLIIRATEVEVPINFLRAGHKAGTWDNYLPSVRAYECYVSGWIGSSEGTQMQSAAITLSDLPDLRLFKSRITTEEEATPIEAVTMRGVETKDVVLTLEAGDWKVQLSRGSTDWRQESGTLYHATLSKRDGSLFTLSEDEISGGIVYALYRFLSFQCEKWINIPTITCNPEFNLTRKTVSFLSDETEEEVINAIRKYQTSRDEWWEKPWNELSDVLRNAEGFEDVSDASLSSIYISQESADISFSKGNPYPERARVNKLSPRNTSYVSSRTASDWPKWPDLFTEFWKRHIRNPTHLNNAIHHYVSCSEISHNAYGIDFAIVAARSTLESLLRWWNGLSADYQFEGDGEHGFLYNLKKAVKEAELGKDMQRQLDMSEVESVIQRASQFRHRIDHGQAGDVGAEEKERIIAHQQYMHNLARLLILAKLGSRDTDARGKCLFPKFI